MAFRPQPFGRYDLLDRISAGGMAEVFRARDKDKGLVVALKRILPEVAEDDEFIAMFEDEARIVSTLEHPNIARALDFGQHEDEWFIAFEYVEGRDMRKLWNRCVERSEHIPLAVLLYIFIRVGEGLAYAHARKDNLGRPTALVHRDVSPQNIVVSFDGDVKLIDFGIAKAQGKLARTQAGTIKGKFGYMAPEQVRGLDVDSRADIFALGVCMWESLTLQRLFAGENELKILEKIRTMTVPAPSSINPDVPRALDEIVLHALAKNVEERHRSAREIHRELFAFSQEYGEVATREEVADYMRLAFPEVGKRAEEMRVPIPRTKGGRRSSVIPSAPDDPYQQLGDLADPEFATTGLFDPSRSDRGGRDEDPEVFEGMGTTSAHQAADAKLAETLPLQERHLQRKAAPSTAPPAPPKNVSTDSGATNVLPPVSARPPPREREATRTPPPPPGRGSLPSVSAMTAAPRFGPPGPLPPIPGPPPRPISQPPPPPSRSLSQPPPPSRSHSQPPPPPYAGRLGQSALDWDDDDNASTNILDRPASIALGLGQSPDPTGRLGASPPAPAAGRPASGIPSSLPKSANATLLGIPAGLPPPTHPKPVTVRPIRALTPLPPPLSAAPPAQTAPPTGPAPSALEPRTRLGSIFPPPSQRALDFGRELGGAPQSSPPPPYRASPPPPSHRPPPNLDHVFPPPQSGRPARVLEEMPPASRETGGAPPFSSPPASLLHGPESGANGGNVTSATVAAPAGERPQARSRLEATLFVNRQSTGIGLRLALGIGLALGLTALVLFFFAGPKTGRLVVNVTDAKGGPVERLEVFVDGKKSCDTTPCYADQLSAGQHEVKVLADGFEPPTPRTTTIESRKDTTVSFTMLGNAKSGSGVKIGGSQPGVKLYVDGTEVGPLPQDLRTLSPGEHRLRLAGSDRYAPLERTVTLGKDDVQDFGQQTLKVVRGKATIVSAPPGAKVYIVSGSDRRELPAWPMSIDIDTSKQWWLEAVKAGFSEYQQLISFDDGQAEKSFVIDLQPKSAAPPASPPPAAASPAPASPAPQNEVPDTVDPEVTARPRRPPSTPTPAPAADNGSGDDTTAVASGEGYLNINSVPASSIILDGKPIGQTPQVHVAVSAGTHQVVYLNADQGLKKQVTVTVGAGETKVAAAKLRAE